MAEEARPGFSTRRWVRPRYSGATGRAQPVMVSAAKATRRAGRKADFFMMLFTEKFPN